jgi:glycosyltransferase involved in cell wall biosynthesis
MSRVLFIAPFPSEQNIKEGMMQRVKAIDDIYAAQPRTYLDISFTKYVKRESATLQNGLVELYFLNFFTAFFSIFGFIKKAKKVYCHSVYCFVKVIPQILFYNKHLVVDMHGVVPEETAYQKKGRLLVWMYNQYERQIFAKASAVICVTQAMVEHFKSKYPNYRGQHIVYSIMPSNLEPYSHSLSPEEHGIVRVLYSGNVQAWQNIDLMLEAIRKNKNSKIHYQILTIAKAEFDILLKQHNIVPGEYNIEVRSVPPSQLHEYYVAAHYGFILRDNDVVNRVANPTKLVEYLHYGMTPIVLHPAIGDYTNYDYLLLSDFNAAHLSVRKSCRNRKLIETVQERNSQVNLVAV